MIQSFGKYPVFPNTRKEFEEQFTEFEEKFIEKGKRLMMYGCSFNIEGGRAKNRRWPFFHKFNIQFTTLKSIILYDCKISLSIVDVSDVSSHQKKIGSNYESLSFNI